MRYANHAAATDPQCNATTKLDPRRCLIWLEATREICAGEEILYDYVGGRGGLVGCGGMMLMHSTALYDSAATESDPT